MDTNYNINRVIVYVDELQLGMYVAELDKPWTETPFLFQGFTIDETEQIDEIKKHCEFVYVDEERSRVEVNPGAVAFRPTKKPDVVVKKPRYKPHTYSEASFRDSLASSTVVYKDARNWVDTMLGDSRLGSSVNTDDARNLVTHLADEVITNPDALVWLTHMRSRDEYTASHCVNVSILALTFGRALNLDEKELHQLGLGALLHDIGKMKISNDILNKPGKLTKEEFEVIKGHPGHGHTMLKDDHSLDNEVLNIVLNHHERLDGTGYPNGLSERQINHLTRITTIVDVYDAITADRCYHDAVTPAHAMENLFSWHKGNFDYGLLQEFIKCIGIYPIGTVVRLNSGEAGIIVATDMEKRLQPVVLLVLNSKGEHYMPRRLVNLGSAMWKSAGRRLQIEGVLKPEVLGVDMKSILEEELHLPKKQAGRA